MERFKQFQLSRGIAKEARRSQVCRDPFGYLKERQRKKTPSMRLGLVEELYQRVSAGESLHITGYPGCGKSTLLAALLEKSCNEGAAGLGISVTQRLGGYSLDFNQIKAVWALVANGYKPRFLAIDDATEVVPALKKTLAGDPHLKEVHEYQLLLDILARLPDSTPLVLSFPLINPTIGYSRESAAEFFGNGTRITIPSVLASEDFAIIFDFIFASAFGRKGTDEVRKNGLCELVAGYLGLYEKNISTLLMRWALWPGALFKLSKAGNSKDVAAIIEENRLLEDFAWCCRDGFTISRSSVRAALVLFDGGTVMPAEYAGLREHGIVMDANFLGDTLTYRAFRRALQSLEATAGTSAK